MPQLKKEIGFKTLLFLTLNSIIGSETFFVPAMAAAGAGPASIISWLIMSVIAIFMSMYIAELVSMYPKAGGTYEYAKQAFGEFTSFLLGWLVWIIANVTTGMVIVGSIIYILPSAPFYINIILSLGFILAFNFVNYRGIGASAKMALIFGIMTIAALLIIIIPGVPKIDIANYFPFFVFPISSIFIVLAFTGETFFGWEGATFLAEEVKDARRAIPKALIISTVFVAILAIALALVSLGVMNWKTFSMQEAPYVSLASVIYNENIAKIIAILIFVPMIGTAATWVISSPRLLFAMARDKVFISSIKKIHPKYRTPHIAIIFQTIMTIIITLVAFGSYKYLLSLLIPLDIISFAFIMATVVVLRFRKPKVKRYFKAPFGKIGPILIVIFFVFMLITWLQEASIINMFTFAVGLILLGIPAYIIIKLQTDRKFIEKFFDRMGPIFNFYILKIIVRGKHRNNVIQNANLDSNDIVLDYGCASGSMTKKISKAVKNVIAADISQKQLKRAIRILRYRASNVIYVKMTKEAPFKRNIFDKIVSVVTLNYFVNPRIELRKLYNCLRPGGTASFLALITPTVTTHPFLKHENSIKTVFREAGFKNIKIETEGRFIKYIYIAASK
ncbi:MAG: amino acid permease [Candidatus Aenigmarchaeota archaeon]|nr:amino acid permease [Candidatus Aenigmarchaeota archaeon]